MEKEKVSAFFLRVGAVVSAAECGFPPFRCGYLSGKVLSKLRADAVLAAAYAKID